MAQKLPAKVQIKSPICTILLSKSDFSFALLLVTFEPLDIQQSYIPLLKALKCGINAVGAQGRGCSSLLCHAHLKMGVLLHKQVNGRFILILAVCNIPYTLYLNPRVQFTSAHSFCGLYKSAGSITERVIVL